MPPVTPSPSLSPRSPCNTLQLTADDSKAGDELRYLPRGLAERYDVETLYVSNIVALVYCSPLPPNLRTLFLEECSNLREIGRCDSLEYLKVSGICHDGLVFVLTALRRVLPALRRLNIDNRSIGPRIDVDLTLPEHLRELRLRGLAGLRLPAAGNWASVERLVLDNCLPPPGRQSIVLHSHPRLTSVDIIDSQAQFGRNFPSLGCLRFGGNARPQVPENHRLTCVDVRACSGLQEVDLRLFDSLPVRVSVLLPEQYRQYRETPHFADGDGARIVRDRTEMPLSNSATATPPAAIPQAAPRSRHCCCSTQ